MNLLEFITFCRLKGYVVQQYEVNADWDTDADSHWKIVIQNGKYKTMIAYAVLHDTGVIVSSSLRVDSELGLEFISRPEFSQIVEAILSE